MQSTFNLTRLVDAPSAAATTSCPRILLIADDRALRASLRLALEAVGWQVWEAPTVAAGLRAAELGGPDVVVLDLGLPDIDGPADIDGLAGAGGLAVLERFQAADATSWVPVVVLTERADPADIRRVLSAGAYDHVGKPFSKVELQARVSAALKASLEGRRRAEPERELQLLADNMTEVVVRYRPDGIASYVSPSSLPRFGWHPDEDDAQFPSRTRARLTWEDRIEEALEHDRFTLYCQPILDLSSGHVSRYEVLLRLIPPEGDLVPPGAFLGVAERTGLIARIDRWVIDRTIDVLCGDRLPPDTQLEVNISGRSLGNVDLLDHIESRLAGARAAAGRLIFEVTETAAIANIGLVREFAQRLRSLGSRFALDDFGSGFGNFYYLKHLPFEELKIDGEFIVNCVRHDTDRLFLEAIVRIAKGLRKTTIAEFVEDEATLSYLHGIGVDFAQGYHVGRPVPLTTVAGAQAQVASAVSRRYFA